MAKCIFTHKAVEDISKIWSEASETSTENQADNYYILLVDASKEVAKKPAIGKNYDQLSPEILGFAAGKHIIFYRKRATKGVEIIRILHEEFSRKGAKISQRNT